jgi:quercetin dioxygenase-like cupin family protein
MAHLATLAHDFPDDHVIPEHFHPEDQLIFASTGVMTVRTKQGIWLVPPLRAVWIPPERRTPWRSWGRFR